MNLTVRDRFTIAALNFYLSDGASHSNELLENLALIKEKDDPQIKAHIYRIISFIAYKATPTFLSDCPVDIRQLLEKSKIDANITNLIKTKAIEKIASILAPKGIQIILLKGMALNNNIYADEFPRLCSDIDILVKYSDRVAAIDSLLIELNVAMQKTPSKFDNLYELTMLFNNENLPPIDLHFHLAHPTLFNIDESELWSNSLVHPHYKKESVRTLSYKHMLIHNAIHNLKDIKYFTYGLFDSSEIIRLMGKEQISDVLTDAHRFNIAPSLTYLLKILQENTPLNIETPLNKSGMIFGFMYLLEQFNVKDKSTGHRLKQLLSQLFLTNKKVTTLKHFYTFLK